MKRTSPKTNAKASRDHRSKPLDLTTVKTTREATPRTRKRIFGLTEAPTYHPTSEEFKDPLKYINKIQPEAEQYGIIKIVPPKDYKPEFCLNTEAFRFRTRIQKLNSMEGQTRASLNYWDQLRNYHRSQGKPIYRIPQVGKRPIDLYKLKKVVVQKGGYHKVCNENGWLDVGKNMGHTAESSPAMSSSLRKAYTRLVLPYEIWLAKHNKKSTSSLNDTDDDDPSDDSASSGETDQVCEICHRDDNAAELLLCDDCDRGYHMGCLTPPLASVPSAEWYCINCLTDAGKDYGFEEGDEYSLSGFQTFCDKFKMDWFSEGTMAKSPLAISEEDCEDEFWRLVDDPHETCEVEYGADLHSTRHGSASASIERGPNGIKGDDPWNPYILPILPDSLFTHVKTDISGMMVPWLYIGMCFSAFCWHNEDHYTYSVNYMHWGETKTWYGVPGEDTAKFEDTMKKAVPELFEQQPNLLFQLVTMLSPGRLLKEKVRVYAVDQRPGEFVVTFPKAYHSGFNHGFNFCEAVNFAPVDWLPLGLECAKRYKEHRRQPCFSHDELLINVAKMDLKKGNAAAIKDALVEMESREIGERNKLKKHHPSIKHLVLSDDHGSSSTPRIDEQHQCLFCRCYTFLSYVTCSCTSKVTCLDHINELCDCGDSEKRLMLRYTDDGIRRLVEMTKQVAKKTSDWDKLARTALSGSTMPSTTLLKQLLMEADKRCIPLAETMELRSHLDRIQQWERQASHLLYTMNKKSKRSNTRLEANHVMDDCMNDPPSNGERYLLLRTLLQQSDTMAFDSPYIAQLRTLVEKLDSFQQQAKVMVGKANPTPKALLKMVDYGYSLNADIEEMDKLKMAVAQQQWIKNLEPQAMKPPLDLDTIVTLVRQARQCMLPAQNPKFENALAKLHQGNNWVKRARHLLVPDGNGKTVVTMDALDDLLNVDTDVPTLREMYEELRSLRSNLYASISVFNRTMMKCLLPDLINRPTAKDIRKLQAEAINIPSSSIYNESRFFDHEMGRMDKWTIKAKSLLVTSRNGLTKSRSLEMLIDDIHDEVRHIVTQHAKRKKLPPKPAAGRKRHQNFCICHQPESGFMIKCDTCADWYHGSCVRELRKNFNFNSTYTCPVCDPSNDIFSLVRRPKVDDFCDLMEDAKYLKVIPENYLTLQKIQRMITPYRDEVVKFCRSKPVLDVNDIGNIKQYLKELLGLPIALEDETDFLRKKVYDIAKQKQQTAQHYYQHQYQQQQENHYTSMDDSKLDFENQHQHHHISKNDHTESHQYPLESTSVPTPLPSTSSSSSSSTPSTTTANRPAVKLILNPPAPPQLAENNHNTSKHQSQLDNNKRKSDTSKDHSSSLKKKARSNSLSHSPNSSSNNYSSSKEKSVFHRLQKSLFNSSSL